MRNRNVPIFCLIFGVMGQGLALAQSSNGAYSVMAEGITSGGGQIGGGNPMTAQTTLGLPAG